MTATGVSTIDAYANLAVTVGANVQPGQDVLVIADVEHAALTRAVVRQAFLAGARFVDVEYRDARLSRIRADLAPDDGLGWSPPYRIKQIEDLGDRSGAVISITAAPDESIYAGVDGERLARNHPVDYRRAYLNQVTEGRLNWAIVAGATPAWAERVFGERDVDRLWQAIAEAVRLDEPDPVAAWREHVERLDVRAALLTGRGFDAMHLRGPGTDLRVGLLEHAIWNAAGATTAWGLPYVANMPTEEVYTSPHAARVDGVVRSTKPLVLFGTLVRDIEIRFSGGRAVEIRAAEGEAVLRESMATDAGASRLGELALVDNDSRVARTGLTFFNTLFDENAASHLAYGQGLPEALPGGEAMSWDERDALGLNQSGTHVDFMVGSPEVDIDGIERGGTAVPVMRGGEFALER